MTLMTKTRSHESWLMMVHKMLCVTYVINGMDGMEGLSNSWPRWKVWWWCNKTPIRFVIALYHISCHDTTRKVVVTLSNPHRGPQERVYWGQSLPIYVVAEHPASCWQAPDKKSVSRSINVNQDKMDWMYEHSHTAWGSESVSMCSWALERVVMRQFFQKP